MKKVHITEKDLLARRCGCSGQVLVSLLLCLTGCGCSGKLPPEVYKEGWRIAGKMRPEGEPDDWIALLDFPQNRLMRVTVDPVPAPDGRRPVSSWPDAYNETSQVMVLSAGRPGRDGLQLWVHDLRTKKGKWIGLNRWHGTSNFTWSEDGRKLAFMATTDPNSRRPRRGGVYVYDLPTEQLTEVADDGVVGNSSYESGSPVWSRDGRHVYYASVERKVSRVDLATLRKEVFPVVADEILTFDGPEIVYVKTNYPPSKGNLRADVIKSRADVERGESDARILYSAVQIRERLVSPSGRFILISDRRGYGYGWRALIDVKTCRAYKYVRLHGDFHDVCATVYAGPADNTPRD